MADQPRMQFDDDKNLKMDAAAALRAELEIEIQNKKQCAYQPYECTQLTLGGYKYCKKHILQDKSAPFKQCNFVYSFNGKRCHLPAPKTDKKDYGYCTEHIFKTTLSRNRQNSKHPPPHSAEVLLNKLTHYVRKPRNRTASSSSNTQHSDDGGIVDEGNELKATKSLDPFVDIDANALYNDACNEVLDLCSESESDVEASTFSSVWHDAHLDSSDDESIDSDEEDVLKHANVYTAEEITLITRDKLMRLQSLYIEQYRQLQHMLKEKRRKYLHSLKRESYSCCNIYSQIRDNPKEQRLYKKLKMYKRYQRTYGSDSILNKRNHDLRAKITDGVLAKNSNFVKCSFTEGGVKCGERALPLSKHCRKHILEDPNQVLFRPCGKTKANVECNTPVEAIFEDSACRLHMDIPPLRSYNQTRKDSESDMDDSAETSGFFNNQSFSDNVKTELIDYNLESMLPKMDKVPTLLFEDQYHDELEGDSSVKSEFGSAELSMDQTESNLTNDCFNNIEENDKVEEMGGIEFKSDEVSFDGKITEQIENKDVAVKEDLVIDKDMPHIADIKIEDSVKIEDKC